MSKERRQASAQTARPWRQFADPAAEVVWAAICVLPEGAQHDVADRLAEHLSVAEDRRAGHDRRRARAVGALREAARMLDGASLTVLRFRELRERHPEFDWPPDSSIRRCLSADGSWNGALAEARLDAVPDPEPKAPSQGPNLTEAEIEAAVAECAANLGLSVAELSFSRYLTWARSPEVRKRTGRRPQSQIPFDRLGGWREVKRRVIGGDVGDAERAINAAGAQGHGYRYTDSELFTAADEVLAWLDEDKAWPTVSDWMRARAAILEAERSSEKPLRAFPGSGVVHRRFGRWHKARHAYEKARGKA